MKPRKLSVDLRSRGGAALVAWTAITVWMAITLAERPGGTLRVVCGSVVVALGVVTIAFLLSGRNPWWIKTRRGRRAAGQQNDAR
jgi:hypothetical protein